MKAIDKITFLYITIRAGGSVLGVYLYSTISIALTIVTSNSVSGIGAAMPLLTCCDFHIIFYYLEPFEGRKSCKQRKINTPTKLAEEYF